MSLLTFVVPWVLLSLIVTPIVGAIIARSLGVEGDLEGEADPIDVETSAGDEAVDSGTSPVTLPLSQYPGGDGADIS